MSPLRFVAIRVVAPMAAAGCLVVACFGECGNCDTGKKYFDGYTRAMWSRTWHAQNSVMMPVTPYLVPRTPGRCGSGFRPGELAPSVPSEYGGAPYPVAAVAAFEPLQFERIGRIPNELDLGTGLGIPTGGAPATAAPRR